MRQARASSEGRGDSERTSRGGRPSDRSEGNSESRGGPLWTDLATGSAGVRDRIQRSCACGGGACPACAGHEEEAVQRKADCSCGGSCAGCRERSDAEEESGVWASLTVGAPDDRYEREAEAVASAVLRMPATGVPEDRSALPVSGAEGSPGVRRIQRRCAACGAGAAEALPADPPSTALVQRACEECSRSRRYGRSSRRNRSGDTEEGARMDRVRRLIASPGTGTPVPREVRAPAERVLGADLSGVRVHHDARSQEAARDIGARAFTHGRDIFLGAGQSRDDTGLMAHELTHTVQQGASPPARGSSEGSSSTAGPGPRRGSGASGPPAVQRIGIPFVDLPSGEEVLEAGEAAYDWGSEKAGAAYDWGAERAEAAYERGSEIAGSAYEWGAERAESAYDWGAERAGAAYERGAEAAE